MSRPASYNTKQREAILRYMISLEGAHVSAAQIAEHFSGAGMPVGRTTIYRHLDRLAEGGKLRRLLSGKSGACYQYIDDEEGCRSHLHLMCEHCGELRHLECEAATEVRRHVLDEHAFEVDALKIVLYGKCGNCIKRDSNLGPRIQGE